MFPLMFPVLRSLTLEGGVAGLLVGPAVLGTMAVMALLNYMGD